MIMCENSDRDSRQGMCHDLARHALRVLKGDIGFGIQPRLALLGDWITGPAWLDTFGPGKRQSSKPSRVMLNG